ncbi:MAG: DNA-binding response regulator [Microbacteriaceae bacterium]
MPGKGRRILVVEDELLMQKLLESELTAMNFQVRTASSVVEAKRALTDFDPDIALMDITLKGGLSGLHLGHMLSRSRPDIAQVYLTKLESVNANMADGLDLPLGAGFVSKHLIGSTDYLIGEIDRVVAGLKELGDDYFAAERSIDELGPKGRRVLELLADGYSNHYIAQTLGITAKSVEYHNDAIYRVLGISRSLDVNRRVEAAVRYQRMKFLEGVDPELPATETHS